METITRSMKIEDFLNNVIEMTKENTLGFSMDDHLGYTVEKMANELRYGESNAQVIKVEEDRVKIVRGVYADNTAKILGQCNNNIRVVIEGDKYGNEITISVNDLAFTNEKIKNVYILE